MDCCKNNEWVELKYNDGRKYYWNINTQETVWNKPINNPCMTYDDYVINHLDNMKMRDNIKRKEHKIKKLEGAMKCSKDVIKKCRKENKKKEKKLQSQLYKMFYQNIYIFGCKNVIQGVELSEKENRVYVTKKKDSASNSISLNMEIDSFNMYVFSFETSNHDIKYHFFSDSEVGNNKKYSIEQIYKINKNKKRTLIKYYANYRDLIVLLDFSFIGLSTTATIYDINIYQIQGDDSRKFCLESFDSLKMKNCISTDQRKYISVINDECCSFNPTPICDPCNIKRSSFDNCGQEKMNDNFVDSENPFCSPLKAIAAKKEAASMLCNILEASSELDNYVIGKSTADLEKKLENVLGGSYEINKFKQFIEKIFDYNGLQDEIESTVALKKLFMDLAQKIRCLKDLTTDIYNELVNLVIPITKEEKESLIYSIFIKWFAGYIAILDSSLGGNWGLKKPLTGDRDSNENLTNLTKIISLFNGTEHQIYRTFRNPLNDNTPKAIFQKILPELPASESTVTISTTLASSTTPQTTINGVTLPKTELERQREVILEERRKINLFKFDYENISEPNSSFYINLNKAENINIMIKYLLDGCKKLQVNIDYYISLASLVDVIISELDDTKKVIEEDLAKHKKILKKSLNDKHEKVKCDMELLDFYIKSNT